MKINFFGKMWITKWMATTPPSSINIREVCACSPTILVFSEDDYCVLLKTYFVQLNV